MKKISFILSVGLLATLTLFSCKKKNAGDVDKAPDFSNLKVEDHKQNIEKSTITFLEETTGLLETEAADVAKSLINLEPDFSRSEVLKNFTLAVAASKDENGLKTFKLLKATKASFKDEFSSIAGVYTYNFTEKDFDEQLLPNSSAITILFPADDKSTTNNAELKITFETVKISTSADFSDLPSKINFVLKVNNKEAASIAYEATYLDKGVPNYFKQTLKIDNFSWTNSLAVTDKSVSYDYNFSRGNSTLLGYGATVSGDKFLDLDYIEDYFDKVKQQADKFDEENYLYEKGLISEAGDIVANVKTHFQITDIKLVGIGNGKKFAEELDVIVAKIQHEEDEYDDIQSKEIATALNNSIEAYLMYVKDKSKIANVEFSYVPSAIVEDTYFNSEAYAYVETNLVFKDGSKVDIESYFEDIMTDFSTELGKVMEENADFFESLL